MNEFNWKSVDSKSVELKSAYSKYVCSHFLKLSSMIVFFFYANTYIYVYIYEPQGWTLINHIYEAVRINIDLKLTQIY